MGLNRLGRDVSKEWDVKETVTQVTAKTCAAQADIVHSQCFRTTEGKVTATWLPILPPRHAKIVPRNSTTTASSGPVRTMNSTRTLTTTTATMPTSAQTCTTPVR